MKVVTQILFFFSISFSIVGQDSDLLGIVDDQLIRINSSSNAIEVEGTLNPAPPEIVRFLTFVEEDCLIYGLMNTSLNPTLISIDMDLNFTVVGALSLAASPLYFSEGLAFNSVDNTLYAAVSINGSIAGGDYESETIVEVNRSTAACQFKTEIIGNVANPDIDRMSFCDNILYFHDGYPGSWSKYFELDFTGIGATAQALELATAGFVSVKDFECVNGLVYFTSGRDLYFFNPANNGISFLGNLFTAADFGGAEILGLSINPFPDYLGLDDNISICDEEDYLLELDYPYTSVSWNNGASGSSILVSQEGQYWADVFYNNCTFRTDTVNVEFVTPLDISFISDTTLCNEGIIYFPNDDPTINVVWNDGTIGNEIEVNVSGTYWAEYMKDGCTFLTNTINVDILEGDFGLGEDVILCEGESNVFTIQGAGQNITWNNGYLGNDLIATEPGQYWADVFIGDCIFRTDTVELEFIEPLESSIGEDAIICDGEVLFYTLSGPVQNVIWSDGTMGNLIEISESGVYWAEYTFQGCLFNTDTVYIEEFEQEYELGEDILLCEGESYVFTIDGFGQDITWNNGYTGSSLIVTEAGQYWADILIDECLFRTDSVELTYVEAFDISIGGELIICEGETINYTVNVPAGDVIWSDGTLGNVISISEPGMYWAEYTKDGCAFNSDTIFVDLIEAEYSIGSDVQICEGEVYNLSVEGADDNITWNNGLTGNPIAIAEPGLYWAEIIFQGCVFLTDTINVSLVDQIDFSLDTDTVICTGETILFSIEDSNIQAIWSDGSTGSEITINETGAYWAQYAIGNCILYSDTIYVNVVESEYSIGDNINICEGDSYIVNLEGVGQNITWNNGYSGNQLEITQPGQYWAEIIVDNCEFRTDTLDVAFIEPLDINIGTQTTLCPGETLILNIDEPINDVVWSDGTIGNEITISESGTYWAEYNYEGCLFLTNTITVDVIDVEFSIGPDITLCEGESYTLSLEGAGQNISWNNGYTGNNLLITEPGFYWAEIIFDDCTFITDTIDVFYSEPFEFSLEIDTVICKGETITFSIDEPGIMVLWNDGTVGNEILVSETGYYIGQYTKEGCTFYTDTIFVEVVDEEYMIESELVLCEGETFSLSLDGVGQNVDWNNGYKGNPIEISEPGIYWAEIEFQNCIVTTNTLNVEVIPNQQIDIGSDTVLCGDSEVVIEVENPLMEYVWNTGENGESIVVSENGTYWVTTMNNGCESTSDSVQITFIEDPNIILNLDTIICLDEELAFSNLTYDILWSNDDVENLTSIQTSGSYIGEYSLDNCYFKTDIISVEFVDCTSCEYFIPNIFSPNSDNINDNFNVVFSKTCNVIGFEISIYDRWGNLVHKSNENHWDGMINSKQIVGGVYGYAVKLTLLMENGTLNEKMIFGDITILE